MSSLSVRTRAPAGVAVRDSTHMFRRTVALIVVPIVRLVVRLVGVSNPWERMTVQPPLRYFGWGARNDFSWYFEGSSAVAVASFEEIHAWLRGCQYTSDFELFHERDFWQHPTTFERLRAGDCEDYALWAWRKLVELGYDADLVAGRVPTPDDRVTRHAWIVFRRDGREYVYEPMRADLAAAVCPLADVREQYIPEVGVGRDRIRFTYEGFLLAYIEKAPKSSRQ